MDGTDSVMTDPGEYTQSQAQAAQLVFEAQMDAVRVLRGIANDDELDVETRIRASIALLTISP